LTLPDQIHPASEQTRQDAFKSVVRGLRGRRASKNRNRSAQTYSIARQQDDKLSRSKYTPTCAADHAIRTL